MAAYAALVTLKTTPISTRLPDPPRNANGIILEHLQSLGKVRDFTCSEQMVKTIPNIRKLEISYEEGADDTFFLNNLNCLDKLESFNCFFDRPMSLINYPQSLKKLSLRVQRSQCWQDILDKIRALPLLEKLKLCGGIFKEGKWETIDGQFCSLKFLSLDGCRDLRVWTLEASHFPRLEQLRLHMLNDLEIPLDFADISTLRLIDVDSCSESVIISAKRILEEQEALYGEEDTTLQVHVCLFRSNAAMKNLASHNFRVI